MSEDSAMRLRMAALAKDIGVKCPVTAQMMLGRKFALPKYRQADYYDQDAINRMSLMMLMLPLLPGFELDDVIRSQLFNIFAALRYDRPALFLERELGEILVKTEIPGFLEASDIHFPFPSIRIMLPKGLLGIERQNRWAMFLDIGHLEANTETGCLLDVAEELDAYAATRMLTRLSFTYPKPTISICSQLDQGLASSYAVTKPLDGTIEDLKVFKGKLKTDFPNDADDDRFLDGMQRLALNILLILSSMPLEYEPLTIERKARTEGKRVIPALARAKFVGDHLLRAKREGHVHGEIPSTGHKIPAHWRSGHFKLQPHGKGHALRRMIFVLPYRTHGPDKES